MKYSVITAAFVLVSSLGFAQSKTTATDQNKQMDKASHCCVTGKGVDLQSLKLEADQQTKLESIMADCNAACKALPAGDAQREETMNKYHGEIKSLLTPEQYKAFQTQCDATRQDHGDMMHEEHNEKELDPAKAKK
ncbi:MAG: hypothetical protein KA408_00395 [Flavobacteriales bacterium]|nr:hypothetical protein [Flavobacteriales bacterium]